MAVIVFWAMSATSTTGSWAWARGAQSTTRTRLRVSRLHITPSFLDGHTLTIHELFLATINAVKRAKLPLGHVHTATEQQAQDEHEGPQDMVHGFSPLRYCHIAGSDSGCVSKTLQICPASTSMVGRVSRRSEEHTSELQSRQYLVCRLLL